VPKRTCRLGPGTPSAYRVVPSTEQVQGYCSSLCGGPLLLSVRGWAMAAPAICTFLGDVSMITMATAAAFSAELTSLKAGSYAVRPVMVSAARVMAASSMQCSA